MFEKEVEYMNLKELVKYITKTFHEPLRKDIKNLDVPIEIINDKYSKKYPELWYLQELFSQFKKEILKHITREDFITFPAIIKFERIITDDLIHLSDDYEIMNKMINDVKMINEHLEFDSYLNSIISLLDRSDANWKKINEFETVKSIFNTIHENNIIHSRLENNNLYSKWEQLQDRLKENLKTFKK